MGFEVISHNLPRIGVTWCFDSRQEGYLWIGFQAGYRELMLTWDWP